MTRHLLARTLPEVKIVVSAPSHPDPARSIGGERASAALPLLEDARRHRLRRGAWHRLTSRQLRCGPKVGFRSLDVGRDSCRFPVPIDQVGRSCRTSEFLHLTPFRARAKITSHFAVGSQACRQGAQDAKVQWKTKKQGAQTKIPRGLRAATHGARRRPGICGVAAPRRCTPASPASRRLASARPALAPKCELIFARTLRRRTFKP